MVHQTIGLKSAHLNFEVAAQVLLDSRAERIAWVDYAKGWSIILVVTMHSALGVGFAVGQTGWFHELVAFAKPFRMPDFFLVAGLFTGRIISKPWPTFVDRKILHFAYFYALWLLISLVVKSREFGLSAPVPFLRTYLYCLIQPFGSMWFLYLLPFLFLAARVTRHWPAPILFSLGAIMHTIAARYPDGGVYAMSSVMTTWVTVNNFFLFYVYFLCGHLFCGRIFVFSTRVGRWPVTALIGLVIWVVIEEAAVKLKLTEIPGATLIFGLAGALAVISLSSLLAKARLFRWLSYCGRNSLVIYLAFFLPMASTRILLLRSGVISDVGLMSLLVATTAIASPLILNRLIAGTVLGFLFKRPLWARLETYCASAVMTRYFIADRANMQDEDMGKKSKLGVLPLANRII